MTSCCWRIRAREELFKFDPEKGSRRPIAQILGEKAAVLAADIADMRQSTMRTNRRSTEYRLEIEGQTRTFSVTFSCVMDSTDQLSGVVTVLHDRTREDEISKLKTDFVSHVSHELRTPLSSIKAYAELLVDGEAADEKTRGEFYHIIQAEAERLSRLIDNILEHLADRIRNDEGFKKAGVAQWHTQEGDGGGDALGAGEIDHDGRQGVAGLFHDRSGLGHDLSGGAEPGEQCNQVHAGRGPGAGGWKPTRPGMN